MRPAGSDVMVEADPLAPLRGRRASARGRLRTGRADRDVSFERQVRAALARLHDLPYLQTHPLGGLRGKALHTALVEAVEGLRSRGEGAGSRTQRVLALRYVEAVDSTEVAARLGVSMGEYYREHAAALAAVASLLAERMAAAAPATAVAPA